MWVSYSGAQLAGTKDLPVRPVPRVLDIGCGSRRDPRATEGMDLWPSSGVTIVHDATRIPWPIEDDSYDGLVSHQFLEHVPQGSLDGVNLIFRIFDEMWRVLKPGGSLEFDTPHADSWDANNDMTHQRLFTPWSFRELWVLEKNPLYPRKQWEFVRMHVDRGYPGAPYVRRQLPRLDRVFTRLHFFRPRYIFCTLRKPSH